MRGVNKVILLGHLGRKPELRATPAGTSVVNFSLATNREWRDRDGEKHKETEWHQCEAWGKKADLLAEYCDTGDALYVEGRAKTQTWNDEDTGEKKYRHKVIVDQFQFVGQRQQRSEPAGYQGDGGDDDIPF